MISHLLDKLRRRVPETYLKVRNFGFALRGHDLQVTEKEGLYHLRLPKKGQDIWLVTPIRHYKYSAGIDRRLDRLARIYFMDRVTLSDGDVVIDCGANIGEIGLWVKTRAQVNYIAIEPGPPEGRALEKNLPGATLERAALWKQDGTATMFLQAETADNSLSESGTSAGATEVPTWTLDSFLQRHGIDHVRLLKIEAEGSEPEVLLGMTGSFARIDYIAIDMGPERNGRDNTVQECISLLSKEGFHLLGFNHHRMTGLFSRIDQNIFQG